MRKRNLKKQKNKTFASNLNWETLCILGMDNNMSLSNNFLPLAAIKCQPLNVSYDANTRTLSWRMISTDYRHYNMLIQTDVQYMFNCTVIMGSGATIGYYLFLWGFAYIGVELSCILFEWLLCSDWLPLAIWVAYVFPLLFWLVGFSSMLVYVGSDAIASSNRWSICLSYSFGSGSLKI